MMNPAKLKTLVDQQSASPNAAALGMAPPGAEGEPDDFDDEDDEGTEPVEPSARGSELIASWGEFGKTLEESADDLHDLAHDAGAELMLKEPDKSAIKAVEKSVDRMPDELSMGLAKYVSELPPADLEAVCTALVAKIGEDKADLNLLCAYMTHASAYAKEEIDVDEDFNVPEETEEDEDETDVEEGADAGTGDAPPEGPPVV
jgi:hypothetical protein